MHATHTPTVPPVGTLREPRPGEGRALARYADAATHGLHDAGWLKNFAAIVDAGQIHEPSEFTYDSKSLGITGTGTTVAYMRVLDLGEGAPAGLIYSVQPVPWIMEESGAAFEDRPLMVAKLIEVNLLAVHRRHRGQGHASAMLADTEAHYAAAGFTTAFVTVDHDKDPTLRPWYERRGYIFCEPGERPLIQARSGDRKHRAFFTSINDQQLAGFKRLSGAVTIGRRLCSGLLVRETKRPVTLEVLLVRGILD